VFKVLLCWVPLAVSVSTVFFPFGRCSVFIFFSGWIELGRSFDCIFGLIGLIFVTVLFLVFILILIY